MRGMTLQVRQQSLMAFIRRVEGQADVERDTLSLRFDLDAGAADLPRSSMDSDSHLTVSDYRASRVIVRRLLPTHSERLSLC